MANFAGLRGTGNWGADERPKNFREMILWLNPNGMAPLTALLSKMSEEAVDDPEFAWFDERLTPIRIQVNFATGFSTTATTLTVNADALRLVAGHVLQVEKIESTSYTNELVEVSSVTDDTTIVVKRGVAGSTAVPILDNAYLTCIGSAFMEGTASPTISSGNPTKRYNYTQIFKTSVGLTRTASKTATRTGDSWANDKRRKAFEHSQLLEHAFLFGRPYEDTSGSKPKRYTGGLRYFFQTNVKIYTTTPTESDLLDTLYPMWDYSAGQAGDERIGFCGNGFLNSLNKLAKGQTSTRINFDGVVKLMGMNLQRWIFPQGVIALRTHPLMNQHGRYTNSAFFVDPTNLKYRYLTDTRFKDNTQANDVDARQGEYLTEAGLEVHHELTGAYIGNFIVP